MEDLRTHKETAEALKITGTKLTWLVKAKKIRAVSFSAGKYPENRYRTEDIERFLAGLEPIEPELAAQKIVVEPRPIGSVQPSAFKDAEGRFTPEAIAKMKQQGGIV